MPTELINTVRVATECMIFCLKNYYVQYFTNYICGYSWSDKQKSEYLEVIVEDNLSRDFLYQMSNIEYPYVNTD